jgi:cell division septation protein DedD
MSRLKITLFIVLSTASAFLLLLSFAHPAGGAGSSPSAKTTFTDVDTNEIDPDVPSWMAGKIDKATYLSERADYINMLRGRPYNLPYDPHERAIQEMERQQAAQKASIEGSGLPQSLTTWTPLGPAPIPNGQTSDVSVPVSGRTIAIAVHPTDPDTVYAGAAQGGLWKSTNGGTNWTPLFEFQLETEAIGAITIDPIDSNIVYIGTGEAGFSADSFFGKGIYIIRNANSVTPTLNGPFRLNGVGADVFSGRGIGRIVVNPASNNTIFICTTAATGGNPNSGPGGILPNRGIYRSTNAQAATPTFEQVSITGTTSADRDVVDMAIDPGDGNLLIASVVGGSADGGIYRSTDALGATPTFVRTRVLPVGATNGRAELAINRNGSVVTVYAAVGETSSVALGGPANCAASRSGYVTRSVDGGLTWSSPLTGSTGFCGGQCFYDIAIAATQDNTTIHLGGAARGGAATCLIEVMKRSTNSGATFVRNDVGLHADSHALAIAPSNQAVVYTGSDGGIWRSGDNGNTWVSKNTVGYSVTQFQSLAVHPIDRFFTIGGTQDNGTNCLSPDGTTWANCRGGDGGYTLIDTNSANTTTAVKMYHTFFNQTNSQIAYERADDTTFNWQFRGCSGTTSNNGFTCGDAVQFYAPMEQGPGNPNTIYFGTDRLYRSSNSGDTMVLVSQGPLVAGQTVTAIGISPQNDNVRIVGLRNGTVFATTTGSSTLTNVTGANFPPANPNDTRKSIGRAVIDPNNPNTAYITFSSYGLPPGQQIFKTTDLNSATPTWVPLSNGIPSVPIAAFVVDPQNSNTMFAGTDVGMYSSTDGGTNWAPLGTGLPKVAVFDAEISNVHRVLRIATHGRGLYEIDIPGQKLPVLSSAGASLTTEGCTPPNGAIDPGEAVTVSFGITNVGGGPTTNLVATLQATGGVTSPGAPQNYGAIPASGTVSRDFTFTANGSCDGTITLTFQLQDGSTDFGTRTATFTLGALNTSAAAFTENFDGVTAPNLPAGWTTAQTTAPLWATTTAFADTTPNSAATDGQATPGDNSLTSPTIAIPTAPGTGTNPAVQLSFRNYYNTEGGFDGGVLEISINGGAFADILTAGGTFVSGGYNGTIGVTDSVLTGRQAWTGNSNGFITTVVKLPAAALGQNAQFKWRTAYDTGTNPAGGGMRVDTISMNAVTRICCNGAGPTPTATATATPTATATATATATPTATATATATPTATATSTPTATATATATATPTATATSTPTATATATATPTATATATATPTATATATPTASATATPTASATATPTSTPTATPTAVPAQAVNISTRLRVETGDNVMIAGFIITGNVSKDVVIRGLGPSLTNFGMSGGLLADPIVELRNSSGVLLQQNNNWKDDQRSQIEGTVFQPTDDRESVILRTLAPGAYTAILKGVGNTTGVGTVEVYDNNQAAASQLANISTRGFVQTGQNVMIGGFMLGNTTGNSRVAVRGLGPSLASFGLGNVLADPTLELHNSNGTITITNDDWTSDVVSAAQLTANGLAPSNPKEAGIFTTLPPGSYTAVLQGTNSGTGIGLIEIYNLQ